MNVSLAREVTGLAESLGAQLTVILGAEQLDRLAELAPDQFRPQFDLLRSEKFKDLQTAVLVGVYGYDEDFAVRKKQPPGVGGTGIHQNYWKLVNDIGEELLRFLEGRAFAGEGTGEGLIPVKYVLNRIGVGKYGKNSLIYTEEYGSYVNNWYLLFTNAPLEPTHTEVADEPDGLAACGKCGACIARCPTQAIVAPYQVDMERCITYLTHRAPSISKEFFEKLGNWVWGCNVCQNICPANAKVIPRAKHKEAVLHHPGPTGLPPAHKHPFPILVDDLDPCCDRTYLQNVLIALGNTGSSNDESPIRKFSKTPVGLELKEYCDYALKRIAWRTSEKSTA
jgi:ferredoxin